MLISHIAAYTEASICVCVSRRVSEITDSCDLRIAIVVALPLVLAAHSNTHTRLDAAISFQFRYLQHVGSLVHVSV